MGDLIQKKLSSQRGISLMMAMLFFLICISAGSVMLTAASANTSRIEKNLQDHQNRLAMTAAVNLLRDDLNGAKMTLSYKRVDTVTTTQQIINGKLEENTTKSIDLIAGYSGGPSDNVTFQKVEKRSGADLITADELDFGTTYLKYGVNIHDKDPGVCPLKWRNMMALVEEPDPIPISIKPQKAGFPVVNGELRLVRGIDEAMRINQLYPRYTLIFNLHIGNDVNAYATTLRFEPELKTFAVNTKSDSKLLDMLRLEWKEWEHKSEVTWKDPVITKGGAA